jgi:hypothetical protein
MDGMRAILGAEVCQIKEKLAHIESLLIKVLNTASPFLDS